MLGKLIKHEGIATGRKYVIFYLVLAMVTLCNVLIQFISIDSVMIHGMKGIVMGLYILTIIGVLFCSVGFAVIRFYKNMVSEEGYLTFTLPAKVEALVAAKLVVAFLWQLVTVILCILSGAVILFQGRENEFLKNGAELLKQLFQEYGGVVFAFLLFLAVSLLYQIIVYYLSIAIGQLFSGNKIIGAVAGYCLLNFALQVFMIAIMVVLGVVFSFKEIDAYINSEQGLLVFLYVYSAFMACMTAGGICAYLQIIEEKVKSKLNYSEGEGRCRMQKCFYTVFFVGRLIPYMVYVMTPDVFDRDKPQAMIGIQNPDLIFGKNFSSLQSAIFCDKLDL